jgi:hypothetical protein
MSPKKKLIEVALPLDAINKASAKEKSIRHGHPSTLHLWWVFSPAVTPPLPHSRPLARETPMVHRGPRR